MFSTSFWIAGLLSFLASAQAVKTTGTDGEYARLNTNIELNGFPGKISYHNAFLKYSLHAHNCPNNSGIYPHSWRIRQECGG
jgi:hypothetical protein